jgi:signal transduction histidine kinase/AmiR/NasT family two-component response regulator
LKRTTGWLIMTHVTDHSAHDADRRTRRSGVTVDVLKTAVSQGWTGVQDFFLLYNRLSPTERLLLARRQLDHLANGTFFWLVILLLSAIAVGQWGAIGERVKIDALGLNVELFHPFALWAGALIISMLPFPMLLGHVILLPKLASRRQIFRMHALWCAWLTIVALVWLSGTWILIDQPPQSGAFVLGKQMFVYLTILGQIFTVVCLSASWTAIVSVIVIGIFAPIALLIMDQLVQQQAYNVRLRNPDARPSYVIMYVFYYGQLAAYCFAGWFVSLAQNVSKRGILLESLHERAESERQRANNFIVTISHDLKQPLTAIALKLGTLKAKVAGTALLHDVQSLQRQTEALETMIKASFDLSRLHSGTWAVRPRELALPNFIEKVVERMSPAASDKGVVLQHRAAPPYLVMTDPDALDRILQNLIGNAIKYTPAMTGGGLGRVVLECSDPEDGFIWISVTDNGIGIAPDKIAEVFKEYVQVHNPERDRTKGFGLGLSIVEQLAKLLGLRIEVKSTVGEGSKFSIRVPVVARIPPELLGQQEDLSPSDPPAQIRDMIVVLVEDDAGARDALFERLVDWGCYVIDGESADAVLEKIEAERLSTGPHFVISDYRLRQGKDGLGEIELIRQRLGMPALPAVMWTAESSPDVLRRIADAGVELLPKPVDERRLLSVLAAHAPGQEAEPRQLAGAVGSQPA